jgi:hypothetical protein
VQLIYYVAQKSNILTTLTNYQEKTMKKYMLFLMLTSFTLLSGCAHLYQAPQRNEPAAFVKVKDVRTGLATWTFLIIESIDNKPAGLKLLPTSSQRIYPGVHTLTVQVQFNRGFFTGGPREAFSDVTADFKAGQTYQIEAVVQGSKVLTWITNAAGKKVSSVITSDYKTVPQQPVIFIPAGH